MGSKGERVNYLDLAVKNARAEFTPARRINEHRTIESEGERSAASDDVTVHLTREELLHLMMLVKNCAGDLIHDKRQNSTLHSGWLADLRTNGQCATALTRANR